MTELRQRMVRDMQLRNLAPATQQGYAQAVAGLASHYQRSPDQLGLRHIEDYILHLLTERKLAVGTCHALATGIRFFYLVTLGRDPRSIPLPPMRKTCRLPEILSAHEIERLVVAAPAGKHRVALLTAYGGGLRVSELVHLKVTHIHSDRMMIRVEQGKGRRDRYTLLSKRLLEELRAYWRADRPQPWLFPGHRRERHMTTRMAQKIYTTALKKAAIARRGGIHTLRHCFATHLMEAGVDIRTIQILMGHRSILSTLRFLQVTRKKVEGTASPLYLF